MRPLQNRVLPTGEIVAIPERGTMMGNRGGPLHGLDRTLGRRRWVSRQWICCQLEFGGRHREVMTPGRYTELFFLDEATALAAGHRPCFECRREDARRFALALSAGLRLSNPPVAREIDTILHSERLAPSGEKRLHAASIEQLPDGAMFIDPSNRTPRLVVGDATLAWTPGGYADPRPRVGGKVEVLTPPSTIAALSSGYAALLHETARRSG